MAATYQSVGVAPGTNGGSVVIVKPTGLATGDLMIACIGTEAIGTVTSPTGNGTWTLIRNTNDTLHSAVRSYSKIATSGDVSATDFTFTTSGTGNNIGCIMRISGAKEPATYDTEGNSTSASITMSPGSMTGHTLYVVAASCGNQENMNAPTGLTERFDAGASISGGIECSAHTGTAPTFTSVTRTSTVNWMSAHGFFIDDSVSASSKFALLGVG